MGEMERMDGGGGRGEGMGGGGTSERGGGRERGRGGREGGTEAGKKAKAQPASPTTTLPCVLNVHVLWVHFKASNSPYY